MEQKIKFADPTEFNRGAVFVEKRYVVRLPNDHTLTDVMRPDYWKPVAAQIPPLSVVTVLGGADGLDIDLRCVDRGGGFCIMRIIRMMTSVDESAPELAYGERRVEYRPGFGWTVIGHDNGILRHGFATQALANECLRTLQAPARKEAAA